MQVLIVNPKPLPQSLEGTPFPPVDSTTSHVHWRDETKLFSLIQQIRIPDLVYLVSKLPDYVEVHIRPAGEGVQFGTATPQGVS